MFGRKTVVDKGILRRYVVTLADNQGSFSGVLTDADDITFVFEDCRTPDGVDIAGRVFVDRVQIAYRQEV